mgnify:CR=1 FL=1
MDINKADIGNYLVQWVKHDGGLREVKALAKDNGVVYLVIGTYGNRTYLPFAEYADKLVSYADNLVGALDRAIKVGVQDPQM